jgi:hypothetical protein
MDTESLNNHTRVVTTVKHVGDLNMTCCFCWMVKQCLFCCCCMLLSFLWPYYIFNSYSMISISYQYHIVDLINWSSYYIVAGVVSIYLLLPSFHVIASFDSPFFPFEFTKNLHHYFIFMWETYSFILIHFSVRIWIFLFIEKYHGWSIFILWINWST